MAKKKLIPTWVKVAAVAALFVPYKIEIEKDDDKKLKKLSARSLATRITYIPKGDEEESDVYIQFPGYNAEDCFECDVAEEEEFDPDKMFEDCELAYDDLFDTDDTLSDIEKEYADGEQN